MTPPPSHNTLAFDSKASLPPLSNPWVAFEDTLDPLVLLANAGRPESEEVAPASSSYLFPTRYAAAGSWLALTTIPSQSPLIPEMLCVASTPLAS